MAGSGSESASPYPIGLALPLGLFFLVFFAVPLALLLWVSAHPEGAGAGAAYGRFFTEGLGLRVLGATLRVSLEATLLCLLLGYPLALVFARAPGWARGVITLIVMLPLLTSVVVRTFAWIVILGRQGVVNAALLDLGLIAAPLRLLYTEGGLVAALVQVQLPLTFLPLATALERVDPNLADASAALGANAWRTFRRVTVPLTVPGAVAGATLTFAAAVTAFNTQSLFGGGQMLLMPGYIYQQAITLQNWPYAAAISIVFLAAVLAVIVGFNAIGRYSRGAARA